MFLTEETIGCLAASGAGGIAAIGAIAPKTRREGFFRLFIALMVGYLLTPVLYRNMIGGGEAIRTDTFRLIAGCLGAASWTILSVYMLWVDKGGREATTKGPLFIFELLAAFMGRKAPPGPVTPPALPDAPATPPMISPGPVADSGDKPVI